MNWHLTIPKASQLLAKENDHRFITLLKNGTMSVEYYAPREVDKQTPHQQDELYVVASGSGFFLRNQERVAIATGDVLFVPAGINHRFEDFSDDFATWVVFYGADGGE